MDRIALIADIHGNIPALHAVEADLHARGVNKIYCLGDMCGRGPNGAAVIDWCRVHCDLILMGNWEDYFIQTPHLSKAKKYIGEIGEERFQYLHTLPYTKEFWISGNRIHLFHGRPIYPKMIWSDDSAEEKLKMFLAVEDSIPPEVIGYADIHQQYKTDFPLESKTVFNTGSVGNSFSSNTACYAILHGDLDQQRPSPFSIELLSVPYDIEAAVHCAKTAGEWYNGEKYIVDITRTYHTNIK